MKNWLSIFVPLIRGAKDFSLYGNRSVDGLITGNVWLLIGSKNNLDTLKFLETDLEDSQVIATNKKVLEYGKRTRLLFHHSIFHWYQFLILFFKLVPIFGKQVFLHPHYLSETVGLYEASIRILKQHRPRVLIFTNDHFYVMRALMWAAKELKIPTVYIQHASMNEYFPPLKYDLNLLEGKDSLNKYSKLGKIEGQVKLIGMPKFDDYLNFRNNSNVIRKIAVCVGILDRENQIIELLEGLINDLPEINVTFRKHPREERHFNLPMGVFESNPKEETIFECLKNNDLLIAGDTSTHLEATLLNIPSFYYPLNPNFDDYYGYAEHGLVDKVTSINELIVGIQKIQNNKPDVFQKARYYNEVVGTEMDGKSKLLALQNIKSFLDHF